MATIVAAYAWAWLQDDLYHCGSCGSVDDWIELPTDVGCTNCGTLMCRDQLPAYYAVEV